MGFWHTSYIEFHEKVGLNGYEFETITRDYRCGVCGEVFATADALQTHRFESHPLHPPVLIVQGAEVGSRRVVITSELEATDVVVERCDRALINGRQTPVESLGEDLAARSWETCRLILSAGEAEAEFTLQFRIASEDDLTGVEDEFARIAHRRRLDMRTVDDLITATRQFRTAEGYSDAICTYLHGVLAKERAAGCPLPYERYGTKYTESVEELNWYDRPLARAIVSVIEFHHNHFSEAALKGRNSRIGAAARKYERWLHARDSEATSAPHAQATLDGLDSWITDQETEQVVHWVMQPTETLVREGSEMEAFLRRDVAEFDRVKVRILLAETYLALGERSRASEHAKSVGSLRGFEQWAEGKIVSGSGRAE